MVISKKTAQFPMLLTLMAVLLPAKYGPLYGISLVNEASR